MREGFDQFAASSVKSQEEAAELLEKLIEVGQPRSVFSDPHTAGEYTLITASEVSVGMGFGFGSGYGSAPAEKTGQAGPGGEEQEASGGGGGGGGGGASMARPVALISVGPDGVHIEPIVDPTKIMLAAFTALGAMLIGMGRMRRMARG